MARIGDSGFGTLDPDAVNSLIDLVADDREALAEIVDAFLEDAPQRLGDLRQGIETGDAALVGRAAHTLKANGRTFGAGRLALLCEEIETAARGGDLAPASARVDELSDEWQAVRPHLATLASGRQR